MEEIKILTLIFFKTSSLGLGNIVNGLIGGVASDDRRYIEYVDGTIMADGNFYDVSGQFFGTVYDTGVNIANCLMIRYVCISHFSFRLDRVKTKQ
jgi:hypothetical protein